MKISTAALLGASLIAPTAYGSSCNVPIIVSIKFAPGAACWRHNGKGTEFVGRFQAGQQMIVSAAGESYSARYGPGGRHDTDVVPWSISISGPDRFSAASPFGQPGRLDIVAPATGEYHITMYPCAIWGAPGMVSVCAH